MVSSRFVAASLCVLLAGVVSGIPLLGREQPSSQEKHSTNPFHKSVAKADFKFQDLNFLQLTDVHSWLSGHAHEAKDEAGYPDVLAFVQHLQSMAWKEGKDLFLFNSGDIVDGTGLSDATQVRGVLITPIIQQMPFTALTSGNHELYHNSTVNNLAASGFVDFWGGHYLTANIFNATTGERVGSPYTIVTGKMGKKLLVMGFLYNMQNSCEAVKVQPVAEALQMPWFGEAMAKAAEIEVDAIVVLVHMDAKDPLVSTIKTQIRAKDPKASIVFLAGHTHIRDFQIMDSRSVSMESGKYLDTVGFVSCSLPATDSAGMDCENEFVTPHVATFMKLTHTDKTTFETPGSKKMRRDISVLRSKLGLDEVIGCSPATFYPFANFSSPHSMWALYLRAVLPAVLYPDNPVAVFVAGTGALRYKLYKGEVHLDDTYTVSPFKDIYYVTHVAGQVLAQIIEALLKRETNMLTERTSDTEKWSEYEEPWVASIDPKALKAGVIYDLVYVEFDGETVGEVYEKVTGQAMSAAPFRSADVDSRNIWEKFVRTEWPCDSM
mmetsp:Transcript_37576/g.88787  ORF Transcript_37576/g.88787 Transcript_37576/m.88787 type:complete len:549 (+) Transcript_37576:112-1758(+)